MIRLIQFALTQRLLMLLAVLLLAGGGYIAFSNLPIDAYPDVSPTQVKVIVKAPGMTPEEVESRIIAPVENELLGIPLQAMLRSTAKYAIADITLDFEDGTDIYWARQQVTERLNRIWNDLPDGVGGGVAPITTPLGEVFMFTIDGGDLSLMERRNLLDWTIRPALRTVPGVADVNTLGGLVRSFEVVPDEARLAARGIAMNTLLDVLSVNNRNDGAGRMNDGEEALLVRSDGRIKTIADLADTVVAVRNGVPIRIGDVAEVRIGAMTRYGAVTEDGKGEAVEGLVLGLRGANARELLAGVEAKIATLAPSLPKGVTLSVFYNRGNLVDRAVHSVTRALEEAIVLVLVLLLLFLGNLRAALTVALILPLAALFTFILMRWFGMSANLMSLGGLAIAIGMLVDAAVVVVENIVSGLADEKRAGRLPRLHLIFRAVREVAQPVTSGMLIIIIVFLPVLTLQGLEGKLFRPVALTIVFALTGSLLMSPTVIPVIASLLLRKVSHQEPWLPRKLLGLYEPALKYALGHSRMVIGISLALLVATGFIYTRIGKTFMPTLDEGNLIVQLESLPSINLGHSIDLSLTVQRALLKQVPEITRIVARSGSDEIGLDPMGLNETDSFLVLKPRSEWSVDSQAALIEKIRAALKSIPGYNFGFTQPIEMRLSEMLTGVRGDLAVKIFGLELGALNDKAQQIAELLRGIPGAEDVLTTENKGMQYLQLRIDRAAAGRFGISVDELEKILRAQVEGVQLGIVQEGIQRTPLIVRAPATLRDAPSRFVAQRIALPDGRQVPLEMLAHVERTEGVVSISRERGSRFTVVRANVSGRDLVGFVEDAKKLVSEKVTLPSGYHIEWGGQFENQQRAAQRLSVVVPISIGLIFLMLFSTFGSIRQAILVLTNIPFAMIGGVFALWISGAYLSVPASVGFIALLGIAVLNGVVMLTYFNQLRAANMEMAMVVTLGAARRLRPVMMTASIAAFGLVPLLFATGPGSEIQKPLAIVVIGGLVSSTLLTLILLPILYERFGEARRKTT
ncbi:MAG TPA: CusA/CzcA family heavy metal efflux RND transporter [Acetobacteraceae bacterium]|jgi:heavy metal efflux system protein|nr:CusA/CzcA family heavy metal efflux RND transporter [Acetobacteraceae bacterium]